jgi:hypothetical protein
MIYLDGGHSGCKYTSNREDEGEISIQGREKFANEREEAL